MTDVVLTHLHADHVGWLFDRSGGADVPDGDDVVRPARLVTLRDRSWRDGHAHSRRITGHAADPATPAGRGHADRQDHLCRHDTRSHTGESGVCGSARREGRCGWSETPSPVRCNWPSRAGTRSVMSYPRELKPADACSGNNWLSQRPEAWDRTSPAWCPATSTRRTDHCGDRSLGRGTGEAARRRLVDQDGNFAHFGSPERQRCAQPGR